MFKKFKPHETLRQYRSVLACVVLLVFLPGVTGAEGVSLGTFNPFPISVDRDWNPERVKTSPEHKPGLWESINEARTLRGDGKEEAGLVACDALLADDGLPFSLHRWAHFRKIALYCYSSREDLALAAGEKWLSSYPDDDRNPNLVAVLFQICERRGADDHFKAKADVLRRLAATMPEPSPTLGTTPHDRLRDVERTFRDDWPELYVLLEEVRGIENFIVEYYYQPSVEVRARLREYRQTPRPEDEVEIIHDTLMRAYTSDPPDWTAVRRAFICANVGEPDTRILEVAEDIANKSPGRVLYYCPSHTPHIVQRDRRAKG